MHRRAFIRKTALATAAASLLPLTKAQKMPPHQIPFSLDINPYIVGVNVDLDELLDLAIEVGFESITPVSNYLVDYSDSKTAEVDAKRIAHNIKWGATNLPLDFRRSEQVFRDGFATLPDHCKGMEKVGATRMGTWIMPTHPELHYSANMRQHADRLKECAKVLADFGIQLGLEYVGPKTLMASQRFAFVRTMVELQDLLAEIDEPNVGYILDSFHWFCAEDTVEQILALDPATIASVDLNDARADLTRDAQIDGTRHLPLETGIIDLKAFLQALVDINYTGPVRAEPFNAELNAMENRPALQATFAAMSSAFDLVRK